MFNFEDEVCCDWGTRLWKLDEIWTRTFYGFILFVGETFVLEGAARMSNKRKCAPSHFIFSLYDTQPSSDNFHSNNKDNFHLDKRNKDKFHLDDKDNFHLNDKDNLYLNNKDEFNSNDMGQYIFWRNGAKISSHNFYFNNIIQHKWL